MLLPLSTLLDLFPLRTSPSYPLTNGLRGLSSKVDELGGLTASIQSCIS